MLKQQIEQKDIQIKQDQAALELSKQNSEATLKKYSDQLEAQKLVIKQLSTQSSDTGAAR